MGSAAAAPAAKCHELLQFRRWKCNKRQESERKAVTKGDFGT